MMQDDQGFMWVGTMNGLNRYDGREFIVMLPQFDTSVSLPENRMKSMVEDKNGYIWIITNSDIACCYDTRMETFVNYDPENENKNYKNVFVASNGDVWLWGTGNGCCRVRHTKTGLEAWCPDEKDLGNNVVNFIHECPDKTIWIGTERGLFYFSNNKVVKCNTKKHNFHSAVEVGDHIHFFTNNGYITVFDHLRKNYLYDMIVSPGENQFKINNAVAISSSIILITSMTNSYILDLQQSKIFPANRLFDGRDIVNAHAYIDNKNGLWIYNKTGSLWQYKKEEGVFSELKLIPQSIVSFIDLERFTIYHDSRDIVWITTYGNGLFTLDQNTGLLSHFKSDPNQSNGLRTNYLLSLTEDSSGEIWVGTEYAGISKISLTNYKNKVFYPDGENANIANKTIRMIFEDKNGEKWIGTKNNNIYVFNDDFKKIRTYHIAAGMPYALTEDTAGNKWVGTKGNGLLIYPANGTTPKVYTYNNNDVHSLSSDNLYAILKDNQQRMWLGTFGGGLNLAEWKDGKMIFRKFPGIANAQIKVRSLLQDKEGYIWMGGNNGVIVFNPEEFLENQEMYKSFLFDKKDDRSINNNEVKAILEDTKGRIWFGTSGGGLNLLVREKPLEKSSFKHYTLENGLVNDVIQSILEDNEGNLWISTESGMSKFDPQKENFENFSFSNTYQGDLFCEASRFKRSNGELMFGSFDGMYIFDPSVFENSTFVPPVMITGLNINGNAVVPNGKDSPLKKSISITENVELSYKQNSFSLEFATLNFHDPSSNQYTYILEGYEKTWNPITKYNVATYRNIPAGKYKFKVKGSNSFGVWNEQVTELDIIVVPSIWRSPVAIWIYCILALIIIVVATKIIMHMNKLHNAVEVERQLTNYRLRFFTNISHEFRTPLTIIRASIENLVGEKNMSPSTEKHIKVLEKSSTRLLRLIDQLLEFRRLQNNKMELNLEEVEVISFFRDIYNIFLESAEKKRINFIFHSNEPSYMMLLDKNKLDKVAYNLLSNAFKYTSQNGSIKMDVLIDKIRDILILKVSDSGIGIPKEKQDKLFVRFEQINYSSSGTGIGLHLTSELIKVHKGDVRYVDSELGGACFEVNIPLSEQNYDKEDVVENNEKEEEIVSFENLAEYQEEDNTKSLKNYKLLVIEDDEEVREFLQDQLGEYFSVITAENGLVGLEKAKTEQPELIVCDVMMPEMNGFEVTKRLKSDFQSSHIPIIILTAHTSPEHQIEGIESGADAYIHKPFSMKYLMVRIIKLIEQREKLRQKFTKEPGLLQPPICTTDKDKEFLEKIHKIIEDNLANTDFSVGLFAQSMNMGRTVFYKKVKGITGYSPNEYVKIMRMKKAAELFATTDLNVSEVSYKVGIDDPFYFSKCFKSQFGYSPSQFSKRQ